MNEEELTIELVEATADTADRDRRAARVAAAIRRFGGYRWVGIYDVGDDEIAVVAWDGAVAPAHPRFPGARGCAARPSLPPRPSSWATSVPTLAT